MSETSDQPAKKTKLRIKQAKSSAPKKRRKSGSGQKRKRDANYLDSVAKVLLGTCVVVTPWFYGSTSALALFAVSIVLMATLAIWLIRNLSRRDASRINLLCVPVFLFMLLGFVQMVQLPSMVSGSIAKKQISIRETVAQRLEPNHEELAAEIRANSSISHNTPATEQELSYFLLLGIAFLASARFFCRRNDSIKLVTAMMLNGCALAVFGAFQKVADPKSIYGIPLEFGAPFASFVNRNNAAGYLLMCLGATLAVIMYSFARIEVKDDVQKTSLKTTALEKALKEIRVIFANLTAWRITILLICGLITAGIAITLSRGGTIAAVVGMIATVLFLFRHKRTRSVYVLLIFFLPISGGALLWSGLQGDVGERLSTLQEEEILDDETRVQLWSDNMRSLKDYPVLGAGLGTYRYVYREYQSFPDTNWFYHGENIFVELLMNVGVLGILLLSITVVLILFRWSKLPKKKEGNPLSLGIGTGGFFLLASQAIANFFDFGLYIPSNGITFVVMLGAVVGASNVQMLGKKVDERAFVFLPKWTKWPIVMGLIACCGYSANTFWALYPTERAVNVVELEDLIEFSPEEINQSIASMESAAENAPTLELHVLLAELYIVKFRHELVEYFVTSSPNVEVDRDKLWIETSMRSRNFFFGLQNEADRTTFIENHRKLDFFESTIPKASRHFEKAIAICPLSVRSILRLGELAYFMERDANPYLSAFARFNIQNPIYFRRAGDIAGAHGLKNIAFSDWKQALALSSNLIDPILPIAILLFDSEAICMDLIPDDAATLVQVAEKFFIEDQALQQVLFARADQVLTSTAANDSKALYLLYKANRGLGNHSVALNYFDNAVRLDPLNIELKIEFAEYCWENGAQEKASEIVRECKLSDGENARLKRFMKSTGLE